jgi:hypothetical protein
VRARNVHPRGHTRLPRYARGKRGVVRYDQGVFVFPDTHAHGQGGKPQHVYTVVFEAEELWGPDCNKRSAVYLDCWEEYLERDRTAAKPAQRGAGKAVSKTGGKKRMAKPAAMARAAKPAARTKVKPAARSGAKSREAAGKGGKR